jgi:cytidylate kinase
VKDHGFVIAIDGPAGAGKSSTARGVAELLDLTYVDTGALYRLVALAAVRSGVDFDDGAGLGVVANAVVIKTFNAGRRFRLDGEDVTDLLRSAEVSEAASRCSAHPSVRTALVELQRAAARPPGAVVEGRDIGTVIFPGADLKIFLDAEAPERARRRALERGESEADAAAIAATELELASRDHRDTNRATAPLAAAADALLLETTHLTLAQVVKRILAEARERGAR